jgi:hypothetical protein
MSLMKAEIIGIRRHREVEDEDLTINVNVPGSADTFHENYIMGVERGKYRLHQEITIEYDGKGGKPTLVD